jgi:hypothetical protein
LLALARAGEAFAVIRDRLKPRHGWTAWQKKLGVGRQHAWTAIKVYEGASKEAAEQGTTVEEVVAGKSYGQAMAAWVRGEDTDGEDSEAEPKQPDPKQPPAPKPRNDEDDADDPEVEPNGGLEIARDKAVVRSPLLRQVSPIDKSRPLLMARNWDSRYRTALARGMAVLLLPELDDRCVPAGKEGRP